MIGEVSYIISQNYTIKYLKKSYKFFKLGNSI